MVNDERVWSSEYRRVREAASATTEACARAGARKRSTNVLGLYSQWH